MTVLRLIAMLVVAVIASIVAGEILMRAAISYLGSEVARSELHGKVDTALTIATVFGLLLWMRWRGRL